MIARTVVTAALAGAVVLAPTAALADVEEYPDAADSLTCDASQVEVTNTVDCTVGAANGAQAALQVTTSGEDASIAGTVTSAEKTVADNVATFTITAPSTTGTMGVTALIDGVAADTASIEVVASSASTDDELAGTGFENAGLAAGAGVLLVAGAATVFVAARRRATANN